VVKRMALALPFLSTATLAGVMPTASANSASDEHHDERPEEVQRESVHELLFDRYLPFVNTSATACLELARNGSIRTGFRYQPLASGSIRTGQR
jgi:hypothetical protein